MKNILNNLYLNIVAILKPSVEESIVINSVGNIEIELDNASKYNRPVNRAIIIAHLKQIVPHAKYFKHYFSKVEVNALRSNLNIGYDEVPDYPTITNHNRLLW